MQVTISLLPASLSLVHIPRSRLAQLSHPVLRQILQPNSTFLNITCNEVELSIFADDTMLQDFEPIARRDRYKQRSRSGSGSSRQSSSSDQDLVEISCEKWSVLQIDSHNDQIDSSGERVYELSAPLAAAGISILYQSTYMSDFIFVKESRLHEVTSLFSEAGFHIYSSDSGDLAPKLSDSAVTSRAGPTTQSARVRNGIDNSLFSDPPARTEPTKEFKSRPTSPDRSPANSEVRLLPSEFACVGLSDEFGVDHWGLKIVKLVAFPDLILSAKIPPRSIPSDPSLLHTSPIISTLFEFSPPAVDSLNYSSSSSSSSSNDEEGYFSHSPQSISYSPLPKPGFRSSSDLRMKPAMSSPYQPSSKHVVSTLSTLSPITLPGRSSRPSTDSNSESQVPFFSYTRTSEGSSLTADVYILATLFPPHERHMVLCSGELDAVDNRLANGIESDDEDEDQEEGTFYLGSTLKCLQVDLRRFGLDKYGLVNRFSQVLDENGINHMYSSTVKTANLLVEKQHAIRAHALLRTC